MDKSRARAILKSLADGRDPVTGAAFPPDSPYQQADTVRALYAALDALSAPPAEGPALSNAEGPARPTAGPSDRPTVQPVPRRPINPNRPKLGLKWTPDEDQQLRDAFTAKTPYPAIAATHGRSTGAITSRLVRLGLIQDDFNHPAHRPRSPLDRPPVSPPDRLTVQPPDLSPPPDRPTIQLPDRSPSPPPPSNTKPDDGIPF
jgi:hypothetical protein